MEPDTKPASQTPDTAPEPITTPPVPASSKKRLPRNTLIGIIVAIVLVAAIGAYVAYVYVQNMPANLLSSAIDNARAMKSLAAKFTLVSGTNPTVTFTGDVAFQQDSANAKNGEVILGIGSGEQRIGVNALSLDGSLYLKATNLEALSSLAANMSDTSSMLDLSGLGSTLKTLDGQWYSLSGDDIKSLAQTGGNNNVSGAVSPEDIKKVLDIYKQHQFIVIDKTYNDESIDGTNTAHFSVKEDKNAEVAFLQAVKAANLSTIKVTDQDITDAKQSTNSNDVTIEVWIARDSRSFKQVKLNDTKKGEEATLTLTTATSLPTFDSFQKPANTKPISDIFSQLFGLNSATLSQEQLDALQQMQ